MAMLNCENRWAGNNPEPQAIGLFSTGQRSQGCLPQLLPGPGQGAQHGVGGGGAFRASLRGPGERGRAWRLGAGCAGAAGDGFEFGAYAEGFRMLEQLVAAQAPAGQAEVAGGGGIPEAQGGVG